MYHLFTLAFCLIFTASLHSQARDSLRARIEADSGAVLEHPTYGTILRTPIARFANLPDYPFAAHYVDVDPGDDFPLYMHYLDEGPGEGEIVLLLHGNPAWSYLVRDLVGPLTTAGYRVIAPDLIGFGKSDKPADRAVQTYDNQTEWVTNFVTELGLDSITLHCQDWGGLIGLRVAVYENERFARVAASNTALPDGTIGDEESFSRWRDVISQQVENFSLVMDRATVADLSPTDLIAYDAPFPDNRYTAGPRQLPAEVPFDPASPEAVENREALALWANWEKPLMTLFAEPDGGGVTAGGQAQLRDLAPGAEGQPHLNFSTDLAGHYIREDIPDTIVRYLIEFMEGTYTGGDSTVVTDSLIAYAATFPAMPKELVQLFEITGQRSLTFGSGLPYNDLEYTLYDTDYMEGETNGFDNFMPVDPSSAFPGADRIHIIKAVNNVDLDEAYTGTKGDRIILGTAEIDRPFFLRGTDGLDNDYVAISNFDYDFGYVQLHGERSDYELVYCGEACASAGYYLFYTAGEAPDLIAFIFPCDDLALPISGVQPRNPRALCNESGTLSLENPDHFRFAEPLSTTVAEPEGLAQVGGPGKEIIGGLTLDADGNTYLFGMTDGNLDGQTEAGNEIFVQQLRPDGSAGWVTEIALPDGSLIFDAVTDSAFLYAAGRTLGALPGFRNAGRWDGILLKYRLSDGELVATDQFGNEGLDGYGNIVLDDAGNLYVSAQGSPAGVGGTDPDYLLAKHRTADLTNVWREIVAPDMPDRVIVSEAWGGISYQPGATPGDGTVITAGWYMSTGGANAFVERWEGLNQANPTRTAATRINSPGSEADWVLDHVVDEAGYVYVVGFTSGTLGDRDLGEHDAYIARLDPDLTNPRFVQLGTERSDAYRKVARDAAGNLYAVGYTYGDYAGQNADAERESGDVIVDKFSPDLELLESRQFGTPHEDRGYLRQFGDGVYVGGMTEAAMVAGSGGSFDGFVVRLDTADLRTQALSTSVFSPQSTVAALTVFPNPAGEWVTVRREAAGRGTLSLIDGQGREVLRQMVVERQPSVDVRALPTGVYTLRLITAHDMAIAQLLVE
jgi:haloalkane dehalogenase